MSEEQSLVVDVNELAHLLGCSVRQCWRMRDAGQIMQPLQIGGKKCLRWDRKLIKLWLADGAPHVRLTGWTPASAKTRRA